MRLPRVVITWRGWQLVLRIGALLRRRPRPDVPEGPDDDPDGGWIP